MTLHKETKILLALAILVLGAVWYVLKNDQGQGPAQDGIGDKALPGLEGQTQTIDRVVLSGPEGQTTLMLVEGSWVVVERRNFPARQALVGQLIRGLGAAEKFSARTAQEKFYDRLGLVDRFVEIAALSGSQEVAALKTGDQFYSPTGEGVMTFTFDPATNRAWTIAGLPEVSIEPSFWLAPGLLSLSEPRIKRLEVIIGDNPAWVISKETPLAPGFVLEGENSYQADARAVNAAGMGATDLYFDDVLDPEGLELFKVAEARYQTFDGLTVTIEFFDQNGLILTSLEASFDESVLLSPDTPTVLLDAPADGAAEAEALNQIWQGRVFQIPLQKLAEILKFRREFFRTQSSAN